MIVKRIAERKGMVLVEWVEDDELRRSILPSAEVDEEGYCAAPERGLEYGVPWSNYFSYQLDPVALERSLKNAGVWTVEDLTRNPKLLQGAMVAIAGDMVRNLLRNVKLGSSVSPNLEEETNDNVWSDFQEQ